MAVAFEGLVGYGSGSTVLVSEDIPASACEKTYWLLLFGVAAGNSTDPLDFDAVEAVIVDGAYDPEPSGSKYCYPRTNVWEFVGLDAGATGFGLGYDFSFIGGIPLYNVTMRSAAWCVSVAQPLSAGDDIAIVATQGGGRPADLSRWSWQLALFSGVKWGAGPCGATRMNIAADSDDCVGGALSGTFTGAGCAPAAGLIIAQAVSWGSVEATPTLGIEFAVGQVDPGSPAWGFSTFADFAGTEAIGGYGVPWRAAYGYLLGSASASLATQFACPGHYTFFDRHGAPVITVFCHFWRDGIAVGLPAGAGLCCNPLHHHLPRRFRAAPVPT